MLNFGAKTCKNAGKKCLQLNFQPGYCEDVNCVVIQTVQKKIKNAQQVEIAGETEF